MSPRVYRTEGISGSDKNNNSTTTDISRASNAAATNNQQNQQNLQRSDNRVVLPVLPSMACQQDAEYQQRSQLRKEKREARKAALLAAMQSSTTKKRPSFLDDSSDDSSSSSDDSSDRLNQQQQQQQGLDNSKHSDDEDLYHWLLGKSRGMRGSPIKVRSKQSKSQSWMIQGDEFRENQKCRKTPEQNESIELPSGGVHAGASGTMIEVQQLHQGTSSLNCPTLGDENIFIMRERGSGASIIRHGSMVLGARGTPHACSSKKMVGCMKKTGSMILDTNLLKNPSMQHEENREYDCTSKSATPTPKKPQVEQELHTSNAILTSPLTATSARSNVPPHINGRSPKRRGSHLMIMGIRQQAQGETKITARTGTSEAANILSSADLLSAVKAPHVHHASPQTPASEDSGGGGGDGENENDMVQVAGNGPCYSRHVSFGLTRVYEHAVTIGVGADGMPCPLTLDWNRSEHVYEYPVSACPFGYTSYFANRMAQKLTLFQRRERLMYLYDVSAQQLRLWEWKSLLQRVIESLWQGVSWMEELVKQRSLQTSKITSRWQEQLSGQYIDLDTVPTHSRMSARTALAKRKPKENLEWKRNLNDNFELPSWTFTRESLPIFGLDQLKHALDDCDNRIEDLLQVNNDEEKEDPWTLPFEDILTSSRKDRLKGLRKTYKSKKRKENGLVFQEDGNAWRRRCQSASSWTGLPHCGDQEDGKVDKKDAFPIFDVKMFDYTFEPTSELVEDVIEDVDLQLIDVEDFSVMPDKLLDKSKKRNNIDGFETLDASTCLQSVETAAADIEDLADIIDDIDESDEVSDDDDLAKAAQSDSKDSDAPSKDESTFQIFDISKLDLKFDTSNLVVEDVTDFVGSVEHLKVVEDISVQAKVTSEKQSSNMCAHQISEKSDQLHKLEASESGRVDTLEANDTTLEADNRLDDVGNIQRGKCKDIPIFDARKFELNFDAPNVQFEDVDNIVLDDQAGVENWVLPFDTVLNCSDPLEAASRASIRIGAIIELDEGKIDSPVKLDDSMVAPADDLEDVSAKTENSITPTNFVFTAKKQGTESFTSVTTKDGVDNSVDMIPKTKQSFKATRKVKKAATNFEAGVANDNSLPLDAASKKITRSQSRCHSHLEELTWKRSPAISEEVESSTDNDDSSRLPFDATFFNASVANSSLAPSLAELDGIVDINDSETSESFQTVPFAASIFDTSVASMSLTAIVAIRDKAATKESGDGSENTQPPAEETDCDMDDSVMVSEKGDAIGDLPFESSYISLVSPRNRIRKKNARKITNGGESRASSNERDASSMSSVVGSFKAPRRRGHATIPHQDNGSLSSFGGSVSDFTFGSLRQLMKRTPRSCDGSTSTFYEASNVVYNDRDSDRGEYVINYEESGDSTDLAEDERSESIGDDSRASIQLEARGWAKRTLQDSTTLFSNPSDAITWTCNPLASNATDFRSSASENAVEGEIQLLELEGDDESFEALPFEASLSSMCSKSNLNMAFSPKSKTRKKQPKLLGRHTDSEVFQAVPFQSFMLADRMAKLRWAPLPNILTRTRRDLKPVHCFKRSIASATGADPPTQDAGSSEKNMITLNEKKNEPIAANKLSGSAPDEAANLSASSLSPSMADTATDGDTSCALSIDQLLSFSRRILDEESVASDLGVICPREKSAVSGNTSTEAAASTLSFTFRGGSCEHEAPQKPDTAGSLEVSPTETVAPPEMNPLDQMMEMGIVDLLSQSKREIEDDNASIASDIAVKVPFSKCMNDGTGKLDAVPFDEVDCHANDHKLTSNSDAEEAGKPLRTHDQLDWPLDELKSVNCDATLVP